MAFASPSWILKKHKCTFLIQSSNYATGEISGLASTGDSKVLGSDALHVNVKVLVKQYQLEKDYIYHNGRKVV